MILTLLGDYAWQSVMAIKKFTVYDWPGNIRELKNYIERLVALHNDTLSIGAHEINLKQNIESISYPGEILNLPYEEAKRKIMTNFKQVYFNRALDKNDGNVTNTASDLGIHRSAFHKMLKELELNS